MLDIECFSFLNHSLESDLAPALVVAADRGIATMCGTNCESPHGMLLDLLEYLMIALTEDYALEQMCSMLFASCKEEYVEMSPDALESLGRIAQESLLQCAMQTITASSLVFNKRKGSGGTVAIDDIKCVYSLFVDIKCSAQFLLDYQH